MSYSHMFYAVDLDKLKKVYGSKNEQLVTEMLKACAEDFESNDSMFEDYDESFSIPKSEVALREIVQGKIGDHKGAEALFGYVFKSLCEHLGESIGSGDVAAIKSHSYKSQLVAAGVPIPIPYAGDDFPEIGFLELKDIPAEIERINRAPKTAKRNFKQSILSMLTGGAIGRQMSDAEMAADMEAYLETLEIAQQKKLSVVSFRH